MDWPKLYLDIGAPTGLRQSWWSRCMACSQPFVNLGRFMVSDGRPGRPTLLIETLRRLPSRCPRGLFVFSVQEEVGLRGATTPLTGSSLTTVWLWM